MRLRRRAPNSGARRHTARIRREATSACRVCGRGGSTQTLSDVVRRGRAISDSLASVECRSSRSRAAGRHDVGKRPGGLQHGVHCTQGRWEGVGGAATVWESGRVGGVACTTCRASERRPDLRTTEAQPCMGVARCAPTLIRTARCARVRDACCRAAAAKKQRPNNSAVRLPGRHSLLRVYPRTTRVHPCAGMAPLRKSWCSLLVTCGRGNKSAAALLTAPSSLLPPLPRCGAPPQMRAPCPPWRPPPAHGCRPPP